MVACVVVCVFCAGGWKYGMGECVCVCVCVCVWLLYVSVCILYVSECVCVFCMCVHEHLDVTAHVCVGEGVSACV